MSEALIELTIDGQALRVPPGTTLWDAARGAGIAVPVLCHDPDLTPVGRGRPALPRDLSSPVIAVDHAACILCDRCIRACDDLQVNEVIGRTGKGHRARIAFDDDRPMGESTCVACGECMARCPTGALTDKPLVVAFDPPKMQPVPTVCPYCGVGCA